MKSRSLCFLAIILISGVPAFGQTTPVQETKPPRTVNFQYGNTKWFPSFWSPYATPYVPEPKMSNSQRLHSLIREGKLHLTLQDAIALALENNLDIAVSRYNIGFALTDVLRTQGGGSARGFQGSFQSGALFAGAIGGGVTSTTSAGGGRAGGISGSAGATQLGGGTFDPSAFFSFGWDQNKSPLGTIAVTGVPYITAQGTNYFSGIQQAFQTGTSYQIVLGGGRSTTTSLTPVFNPQVQSFMAIGFTQQLLNGFGRRANSAYIRIAKNDVKVADSVFRQQVITTVTQVLDLYWDLLAYRENVRVAEQSLAYAQKLLSDNKRQVEIGTLAPIEVVRAESEVAARQQDLIVAQTSLQQQQELLKTALSKQVDRDLATMAIEPDDKLPEPQTGDIPALDEALRMAVENRPELEQLNLKMRDQGYNIQRTRNALLPTLSLFGSYIPSGLSGHQAICPNGAIPYGERCAVPGDGTIPPLGLSTGGISQAFTQTFQGTYPDYSFGITLSIPIRNRSAQADAARALLEKRQLETQIQQQKNTVEQDVRNAEIAVAQAKAQIEAARKAVVLAQQTLDAERKKFQLGESTVFMVIQAQRDLATAEGNEVKARSTYAKALTQFNQATGTTLKKYNIELSDAISGEVTRVPNIPGSHPQPRGQQPVNPGS
jgi:outer membrane protein